MPASIGVNLRVTGHCRQGGRKYMEDFFSVAYQQTEDEKDLEYAFFGIYDGHGGAEAAAFAKEHLMETIIKHKNFWSDDDEDVLKAIKDGYIATHYAMWREQEKWPRTASGLPSTAGTTASIAFIRRGKIYIGHVGDSGIILGYQEPGCSDWKAKPLTRDHKPENADELNRIKSCGGKVVAKSGVPRVVWNRPKIGHQGPVRRSTPIDEIPFLAVARSLGDLWSYNYQSNRFIVSPDPDCTVIKIDTNLHRCLVFGTDGLYNMLSPIMAVHIVQQVERHNENAALSDSTFKTWLNPSKLLVEKALERWHSTKMRADNTSVVTLMLDPPGPPRAQVLKDRKKNLPERGLKIMTRFDGESTQNSSCDNNRPVPEANQLPEEQVKEESRETTPVSSSDLTTTNFPLKERNFLPKPRESTSFDPRVSDSGKENLKEDNTIQCNEVSSSNIEIEEDEEGNNVTKSGKRNLRSGGEKRKLEIDENESIQRPRKSARIDNNRKRVGGLVEERRAFEAEEKLKKLAEEADLVKRDGGLSEGKKRTGLLSGPITKKGIKSMFDKVKKVRETAVMKAKGMKTKKLQVSAKKPLKVVSKKATFHRNSKRNVSKRRNTNVVPKPKIKEINKFNKKENFQEKQTKKGKVFNKKKENLLKVVKNNNISNVKSSRSTRNSTAPKLDSSSISTQKSPSTIKTPKLIKKNRQS
ncbi:uncharacterized protein LOC130900985 [Diorhabda carinulata]|uniref:uncharacterized protein LOC130900985 n=1 Tax=Diorhabda carinulata TaxID=1163345 RepID=UPI0025A218EE|nr:uncharacterized protein LOC130900985 [Diorhabda carinulata]